MALPEDIAKMTLFQQLGLPMGQNPWYMSGLDAPQNWMVHGSNALQNIFGKVPGGFYNMFPYLGNAFIGSDNNAMQMDKWQKLIQMLPGWDQGPSGGGGA